MTNNRLDTLLTYLNDSPTDSFILFAIAKEYEKLDHLDRALKYYLQLKTADEDYVGLYYHLGKLYEEIDEDILALSTYADGIALAKKLKDLHALSELNNAKVNLELQLGN